jgi:hypothetical protein
MQKDCLKIGDYVKIDLRKYRCLEAGLVFQITRIDRHRNDIVYKLSLHNREIVGLFKNNELVKL